MRRRLACRAANVARPSWAIIAGRTSRAILPAKGEALQLPDTKFWCCSPSPPPPLPAAPAAAGAGKVPGRLVPEGAGKAGAGKLGRWCRQQQQQQQQQQRRRRPTSGRDGPTSRHRDSWVLVTGLRQVLQQRIRRRQDILSGYLVAVSAYDGSHNVNQGESGRSIVARWLEFSRVWVVNGAERIRSMWKLVGVNQPQVFVRCWHPTALPRLRRVSSGTFEASSVTWTLTKKIDSELSFSLTCDWLQLMVFTAERRRAGSQWDRHSLMVLNPPYEDGLRRSLDGFRPHPLRFRRSVQSLTYVRLTSALPGTELSFNCVDQRVTDHRVTAVYWAVRRHCRRESPGEFSPNELPHGDPRESHQSSTRATRCLASRRTVCGSSGQGWSSSDLHAIFVRESVFTHWEQSRTLLLNPCILAASHMKRQVLDARSPVVVDSLPNASGQNDPVYCNGLVLKLWLWIAYSYWTNAWFQK